jgi:hypothetical protein
MKKKLSWKNLHKNELKLFYIKIFNYYTDLQQTNEYKINGYDTIILTREYTDHLFKNNLFKKELNSHLHHIVPRSCGGTDDSRNLIWLSLQSHCEVHGILYRCNKKNKSIRCAATMLNWNQSKRIRKLTVGEHRKSASSYETSKSFYGESSYSWSTD